MSRLQTYATAAERQKTYRARLAASQAGQVTAPMPKSRRSPSRPARLATIVAVLLTLQEEYQGWPDAMPESLADGNLASKLQDTIEQLNEVAEQLADIQLPRGFGRA